MIFTVFNIYRCSCSSLMNILHAYFFTFMLYRELIYDVLYLFCFVRGMYVSVAENLLSFTEASILAVKLSSTKPKRL